MRNLLLLLPFILLPATAIADLYKWTDANGRVQFSDKKPENGKKVEQIATPSAQSSSSNTGSGSSQETGNLTERQKKISDVLRSEREQQEAEAQKKAEQLALKKRHCIEMVDYKKRTEGARLYDLDEKGERKFMDDKEIAKRLAMLDKKIGEACQP